MKLLAVVLLLIVGCATVAQPTTFMTYNIRLDFAGDGENRWDNRKKMLAAQVLAVAPDFLGVQEALPQQMKYLAGALPSCPYIGAGRDDGRKQGEYSAIFYNSNKFKVLQQATFWLSETPGVPSKGWDAAYNRVCTYGLFINKKSGKRLWVFNTHFDHVGNVARAESAKLILQKIIEVNTGSFPVILMGDFNLEDSHEGIKLLSAAMADSRAIAKTLSGPQGTFNGFGAVMPEKRIDYVFVSKNSIVKNYMVLKENNNGRFVSDHYPVIVEVILK